MEITIASLKHLQESVGLFLKHIDDYKVLAFEGEMGAGKTTFINVLLVEMGVINPKGSPTYSLINEYDSNFGVIYHFDSYRLQNEMEAFDSGMEELLDGNSFCFVEWPQKIVNLLPDKTLWIKIRRNDDNSRTLTF
ncbi:MAG: tRNA (adenosine(37)-N6)-threonylcarbamoyltransferase complex ATPase subunit type 1 TsaE [Bacteroidota bacterium]